ncbi:PREDICTED: uncharacterized protein LOC105314749 [Amphimedon queenslandica]|uniref:Reverse transcriptase domain-containing protein n=2 Tax=Amphimedon queenslandica TaxID=400682 RepID=A0AAN0IR99_AMPQE|nr:PREDICTED: uncharacterized protein LOC105314749 [Amphimedon queenslandica]|eukprot:XP_011407404.1 PREDICTED: uncharacterized protein LOC105314749 [Amphimedon queenslandica]
MTNSNTIYNLSSYKLSQSQLNILNKGLSFSPSQPFNLQDHLSFLNQYDAFSNSLRDLALTDNDRPQHTPDLSLNSVTQHLYREMKFLKGSTQPHYPPYFTTNIASVENFIESTKIEIDKLLSKITSKQKENTSKQELKAIKSLKKSNLVIKPADKNLGIVVMNSNDFVEQCLKQLTSNTYVRVETVPEEEIKKKIQNTLVKFKNQFGASNNRLYRFLQPNQKYQTPNFYGLPKMHKELDVNGLPPLRPIVAHNNSLLSNTAKFIDHILQPLAQAYNDYLKNSTQLISYLETSTIPNDIILVTLDVKSLYTSIPQSECLESVRNEMFNHQDLIIFDPDLITHLLSINLNNNYFEFSKKVFLQVIGTAMGAAFSPTVANIYMSVLIKRFLSSTTEKPFFFKRYIDDIIMLWPKHQDLNNFFNKLNKFHPNIKFTMSQSETTINFLDITIYKGEDFSETNKLSIKTYQKEINRYQYLHFNSNHPIHIFKGLIIGETIRYVRTNSTIIEYKKQIKRFTERLISRGYKINFINTAIRSVNYKNRAKYLQNNNNNTTTKQRLQQPILKCTPPPNFICIKRIILEQFHEYNLSRYSKEPLFVTLKSNTLKDIVVHSKHRPSTKDLRKITEKTSPIPQHNQPKRIVTLRTAGPNKCNKKRCSTCNHFNSSAIFKSTANKRQFKIEHPFTCTSSNVIYLITCLKCQKQYVGKTSKTLRERICHHRSSINNNEPRYISKHFNLPGHQLSHLKVQVIDSPKSNDPETLDRLETHWIQSLNTIQPKGLNVLSNQQI